jgi:hypothetical protein
MFYTSVSPHVEESETFWETQGPELSAPHLEEGESYSQVSFMHLEWRTALGALAFLDKRMRWPGTFSQHVEVPPDSDLYNQADDTSQLWDQAAADAPVTQNNVAGEGGINFGLTGDRVFGGSASISAEDAVALFDPVTSAPQLPEPAQAFFLDNRGVPVGTNETGYPCILQHHSESEKKQLSVTSLWYFCNAIIIINRYASLDCVASCLVLISVSSILKSSDVARATLNPIRL